MMTSQVINLWISQNHKNQDVSRAKHCFFSNKKNRYIKGYFMTKNSFVVDVVTFKDFSNFTERKPVLESLFNKVAGLQAWALLKRDSSTAVFL